MVEDVIKEVKRIKTYADLNDIPIMQSDGIDFLEEEINKRGIKNILEIGTAIGFSAIMMALCKDDTTITSIEKDQKRYLEAVKNINKLKLQDRITLIFNDALEVNLKEKYDLIFIDAAKSKNESIFEHFKNNLAKGGVIITDNLKFHGFVALELSEISNRNTRALVRKIKDYIEFLKNNKEFNTIFFDTGDGLAITTRKED